MQRPTSWNPAGSIAGAVLGLAVGVSLAIGVVVGGRALGTAAGIGLAVAASLAVTVIPYVAASRTDHAGVLGQFLRRFMIGVNAGMNTVLAGVVLTPVIGVILGLVALLAAIDAMALSPKYQRVLGWASWLMPMSWGATALGAALFLVSLTAAGATLHRWPRARILRIVLDPTVGALVIHGGLIHGPTAFDMGNIIFVNPGYIDESSPDTTCDAVVAHETGHTLAVAAFGPAFGLFDLIYENLLGAGARDYGERIAESHANRPGRPTVPMWGLPEPVLDCSPSLRA